MRALLLWCVVAIGFAQLPSRASASAACTIPDTIVYFGNGMFTTDDAAERNLRALKRAMRSAGLIKGHIRFDLMRNANEDAPEQLAEVLRMRLGDSYARAVGRLAGWIADHPEEYTALVAQHLVSKNESVSDSDIRRQLIKYLRDLGSGARIIVVAHSQGNMYANRAYASLTSQSAHQGQIGVVHVATPSTRTAKTGFEHVTLEEDAIMSAVRAVLRDTLAANERYGPGYLTSDALLTVGHGFEEAYLGSPRARPRILNLIRSLLDNLPYPPQRNDPKSLRAVLYWDTPVDLNVHVIEPDGRNVYYAWPNGTSGSLVRDVRNGGEPEVYEAKCAALRDGFYQIGASYSTGTGPQTAILRVNAGNVARDFNVTLPTATGRAGAQSPIIVGTVKVFTSWNGLRYFTIYDAR